jgi:squalene-hopene/tetraprenyl-beta-curcumene cyclase
MPDGTTCSWARELGDKLVALQAGDGTWVNSEMRWLENDKVLATSYAMLALRHCRSLLAK